MISSFGDLRFKEVIDVGSGFRLGGVCDVEFDDAAGCVTALVTPGRCRLFGLLGREDDIVVPWGCIVRIGSDIILVEIKGEPQRKKHRGLRIWE